MATQEELEKDFCSSPKSAFGWALDKAIDLATAQPSNQLKDTFLEQAGRLEMDEGKWIVMLSHLLNCLASQTTK